MWLKNPGQLTSSRHEIKLQTRSIWAGARQRYLVGPASLTTHKPGHMVKVDTLDPHYTPAPRIADARVRFPN